MEKKFFFGEYDFFKEIFFKDFDVLFKIKKSREYDKKFVI